MNTNINTVLTFPDNSRAKSPTSALFFIVPFACCIRRGYTGEFTITDATLSPNICPKSGPLSAAVPDAAAPGAAMVVVALLFPRRLASEGRRAKTAVPAPAEEARTPDLTGAENPVTVAKGHSPATAAAHSTFFRPATMLC